MVANLAVKSESGKNYARERANKEKMHSAAKLVFSNFTVLEWSAVAKGVLQFRGSGASSVAKGVLPFRGVERALLLEEKARETRGEGVSTIGVRGSRVSVARA
eukprot:4377130-Pleurochrysis_carterae.AAC.1